MHIGGEVRTSVHIGGEVSTSVHISGEVLVCTLVGRYGYYSILATTHGD